MRGHIVKRYKGSYTIVLNLGRDPATGKWKQQWVSVKGSKKDAEKRLAELVHQIDTGNFVKPDKLTVGDYLEHWLEDYASTHVRPRTLERYRGIVRNHLTPALGKIPIAKLQPSHVQTCHSRALQGRKDGKAGTLTAKSVLQHHRVLSEALSHAVKLGLINRNVTQAVDAPRPVNTEMRTLDSSGVRAFLEAASHTPYYSLFHLDV